ncbi:Protein T09F3.2 [Aphelenchoides avenae]|nr:Protein T09F3.2 [Aphelenchus avenae]
MDREALIHFVGGALGGTAGTAITCPLEVVKTRLQSSTGFHSSIPDPGGGGGTSPSTSSTSDSKTRGHPRTTGPDSSRFGNGTVRRSYRRLVAQIVRQARLPTTSCLLSQRSSILRTFTPASVVSMRFAHTDRKTFKLRSKLGIFKYVSDIIREEGVAALYKGLLPNLVGVAPSKAVYFYTYSTSKRFWNEAEIFVPNSAMVHMVSAGFAGFVTATVINPVWLVKTRLQLHHGPFPLRTCIARIYKNEGIRGFYKGVTASYVGISETIIQFVLYEHFRSMIDLSWYSPENTKFLNFMLAGGTAKFCATLITYPHEVVRTRLREENSRAKGFWKVFKLLYREGGVRLLYRGLTVQLLRAVPNTAITMGTYEMVVYVLHSYFT